MLVLVLVIVCLSCENKTTELVWQQNYPLVGSQSSPRVSDLNNDGIKDIVLGAGRAELDSTPYGVLALDGLTGEPLWEKKTYAQIFGSATFADVTDDGVADVFIGGRNQNLKAINGTTGDVIWEYKYLPSDDPILNLARFNFYNSQLIPDQNSNGYPELLTINGGNWDALANVMEDRHAAVLMVIDTKSGNIIASDTMPDGRESYMSPLIFKQGSSADYNIIFGTGGETQSGTIYACTLEDLKERKLHKAKQLISETGHGYIAPPVLVDINGDEILDIMVASHAAKLTAIDGQTYDILWEHSFEDYECSSSFTVGQFTDDDTPDFFAVLSQGVWPDYSDGRFIMINGATGEIAYDQKLGCYSLTTPVAFDITHDGLDEVILSVNQYDCEVEFIEDVKGDESMVNLLVAINLKTGQMQEIDKSPRFRNIYGSPWIGDLDDDGYLDIVYVQNFNPANIFRFRGMRIKRISSSIKMRTKNVAWGEYMGAEGKSIYKTER